ncbi:hypothetical protein [Neobacillus terrae]|uniref:hypothetical protein n=1 Tax=Neobacillus terrae TaxID=3034837 RepID=UPI00140CD2D2|nr:hypothetical protein [Neobacillus terrae]NHM31914.1 hypothetical protein [Neobacillus terrae]
MTQSLLDDFKKFLLGYRASWNSLNATSMSFHSSKDLKVRWAGPEALTSDWGYKEAAEGWKQAFQMYEGRNPKWHFEDVLVEINNQQEGVAVFWVSFEVDGKMTEVKLLFVESFRKEKDEWKKIREYVENSFSVFSSILNR